MSLSAEDILTIDRLIDEKMTKELQVIHLGKVEFNELKEIVKELSKSQKETDQTVRELVVAQRKTDVTIGELKEIVRDLAVAQQRTEQRVEELTVAQQRTEQRVEELTVAQQELAVAQRNTESELQRFIKETREHFGSLSHTIGFNLENQAMKALPALLKRDLDVVVQGRLTRGFVRFANGREDEVNIYGQGKRSQEEVLVVGESQSQMSKGLLNDLDKLRKRLEQEFHKAVIPLAITHLARPSVVDYAKQLGIQLYYSYDF